MTVPYTFAASSGSIPLSYLDSNFATTITMGNTAVQLGDTITTFNNVTLASPTITAPNMSAVTISSGNATVTSLIATTGTFSGAVSATTGTFTSNLLVTATALVGYGTGAGGPVTQITSKATQVTLNKPTGKITTNNAALAAGTSVEFGCVNSFVSADDVVIVNASLNANYRIEIRNVSAGSFVIRMTNLQGVSLSEAVAINFAVIKGATA